MFVTFSKLIVMLITNTIRMTNANHIRLANSGHSHKRFDWSNTTAKVTPDVIAIRFEISYHEQKLWHRISNEFSFVTFGKHCPD